MAVQVSQGDLGQGTVVIIFVIEDDSYPSPIDPIAQVALFLMAEFTRRDMMNDAVKTVTYYAVVHRLFGIGLNVPM